MATDSSRGATGVSPDEAFARVGNETRIQILRALGADEPLSFSELYDRVEIEDSGNFTYHLDKLVGHFVRQADDTYALREAGSRIVQAVLSGTVADDTDRAWTAVDAPCPYCGEPMDLRFREERLVISCRHCPGSFRGTETDARFLDAHAAGTVAILKFPPAGLADREPLDVLEAAVGWTLGQNRSFANGVCPRCAAVADRSLVVCEDHDPDGGLCEACGARFGLLVDYRCPTCHHVTRNFPLGLHVLISAPELLAFAAEHGVDPVAPTWAAHAELSDFDETILATDPVEARYTYAYRGDRVALTVDEELGVTSSTQTA